MGVGSISPSHWAEGAAGKITLFPHNWEGVSYCVSFPCPPRERLLLEWKVLNSGSVWISAPPCPSLNRRLAHFTDGETEAGKEAASCMAVASLTSGDPVPVALSSSVTNGDIFQGCHGVIHAHQPWEYEHPPLLFRDEEGIASHCAFLGAQDGLVAILGAFGKWNFL